MSIRIGILGYGNLGRGVECAIKHNPDLELVAVFTRRAPETVKILTETAWVYNYAPMGVMNFSIYMKVKPVTITNGYFNSWGTSSIFETKSKLSLIHI